MSQWDSLYGWGSGSFGRLGLGVAEADIAPERIGGVLNGRTVQATACGWYHSLVCTAQGEVLTFGSNVTNALGLPSDSEDDSPRASRRKERRDTKRAFLPTVVPFPRKVQVVQVACSGDMLGAHSLAVTRHGRLFAWGYGPACGCGTADTIKTPTAVTRFLGSTVAMKSDEYQWTRHARWHTPVKTTGMRSLNPRIVKAAAGANFSLCLSSEGEVFSWGLSASGRLGYRTKFRAQLRPRRIEALKDGVTDISAGGAFALVCMAQGRICSFGDNAKGQLGLGHMMDSYEPSSASKASLHFCRVACGDSHSLGLDAKGRVYAWGGGGGPCTGCGRPLPSEKLLVHAQQFNLNDLQFWWTRPSELPLEDIVVISAGFNHSLALSKEAIFAWGSPLQAGRVADDGSAEAYWIPRLLAPSPLLPCVAVTSCSGGGWHSLLTAKPRSAMHVLTEQRAAPYMDGAIVCKGGLTLQVSSAALRARFAAIADDNHVWTRIRHEICGRRMDNGEEEMELTSFAYSVTATSVHPPKAGVDMHNADAAAGGKVENASTKTTTTRASSIRASSSTALPKTDQKCPPDWSSDSSDSDDNNKLLGLTACFIGFHKRVVRHAVHFLYTDSIDVEIDDTVTDHDTVLSTADAHQLRLLGQKLGLERLVRALDQLLRDAEGGPPQFMPACTLSASSMSLLRETFSRSVTKRRCGMQTGPDTLIQCQEALDVEQWAQFSSGPNLCCHAFVIEACTKAASLQVFDDDLWVLKMPFPVDVVFAALCLFYTGEVIYTDLVPDTVEWHASLLHLAIHLDAPSLTLVAHDMILGILCVENWVAVAELGEKDHFPRLTDAAVSLVLRRVAEIALTRVRDVGAEADAVSHVGEPRVRAVDEFLLNLDLPVGHEMDVSELRKRAPWLYLLLRTKLDEFLKADESVRGRLRAYADYLSKPEHQSLSAQLPWKEILVLLFVFFGIAYPWSQDREIVFRMYAPRLLQDWLDSVIVATSGSYLRLILANVAFAAVFILFLVIGLGK